MTKHLQEMEKQFLLLLLFQFLGIFFTYLPPRTLLDVLRKFYIPYITEKQTSGKLQLRILKEDLKKKTPVQKSQISSEFRLRKKFY